MTNLKKIEMNGFVPFAVLLAALLFAPALVFSQQPGTQDRVAAFKQKLAKDQAALHRYEWVETTTVSLKGEVKTVKHNRCYYGADGKLQKIPIDQSAPQQQQQPSGRRGRLKEQIIANKKEEMTDYMKQAVALVHQYIPPDPGLLQNSRNNEKISLTPVGSNIRLNFPDFIKPGDLLSATLNVAANSILEIKVSTYLESANDVVALAVGFNQLSDGTSYTAKTVLDAPAKNIRVVVENSGYKPL